MEHSISRGSGRRWFRVAIIVFALVIAAVPLARPTPAAAVSDRCQAGVIFIGVRGTGANAGTNPSGPNLWLSGGHGDQVEPVRAKFAASLGSYLWSASLNYPATGPGSYITSQQTGTQRLINELNLITACVYDPPIVLAGHSQGADVIAQALAHNGLSDAAKAQVKAVILYGDPLWKAGMNFNAPGYASSGHGLLGGRGAYWTDRLQSWYWQYGWPYQGAGQGYFSRIRSYCFTNDWACQNLLQSTSTNSTHNSYKNIAQSAFEWAQYMTANTN
ncbi:cutinase family protein [Microbacterium chocolatum]|uniref:cutinase family protein n=1 Tax=Microbacterium aurantiacum TaxID=162393 RepID=UPI00338FC90C